jgi:thiaminase/transcriptional activator TenA
MVSEALWSSIEDIYNSIVNHPFIKGLADGSLDIEKFRFYIVQDHMYLDRFVRALAILASKMPNIEGLQMFTRHILGAIDVERKLHNRLMNLLGIDMSRYIMSPTNAAYTNYLLAEAYSRPYYEGMAAVLPCYWIYERVGTYLAGITRDTREEYRLWINTYSSPEYGKSVKEVLDIINSLELTKGQLAEMIKAFRLAAIYEYLFWDSAYRLEDWPFSPSPP